MPEPFPEPELASIQAAPGWTIIHHRLFHIEPTNADDVRVDRGYTVWDLYFLEDLVLMENSVQGLLLDVGWYPHADPSGTFGLVVVNRVGDKKAAEPQFDWDNPVVTFETRSISELLNEIHKSMR